MFAKGQSPMQEKIVNMIGQVIFIIKIFNFLIINLILLFITKFNVITLSSWKERRVTGISGYLNWSKTLMEQIFKTCGEFRWSTEGPVSQIHPPHLLVGSPRIFSDLLKSVLMLKRECGAESNGKLPHVFIFRKTTGPEFAWKTWFRQNSSLGSCACSEDLTLGRTVWWWWIEKL